MRAMRRRNVACGSAKGLLVLAVLTTACGLGNAGVAPREAPIVESVITSRYESAPTTVRVILPSDVDVKDGRRYPVVYVLPVFAGEDARVGDAMKVVQEAGLADRYQAIFVQPTFSYVPWYADNPDDPRMRQETYLLRDVIPFVERHYPVRSDGQGRFLLGFSKSGWGAFSLLLRYPHLFEKAAAFDSPLMLQTPSRGYMPVVFETQENFERYEVSRLLREHAADYRSEKRFVLLGYHGYRTDLEQADALMTQLGIPHDFIDGPARAHSWDSGWLTDAVAMLFSDDVRTARTTAAE
jgi:enterochelin esterase-like enzyme